MTPTLHFIAGLPRAGSTVLYNLLAQNPRFHLGTPGGIQSLLFAVRCQWNRMVNFKATPNEEGKVRVLRGMLAGYYAHVREPVAFDRSLGWLFSLEMAELILQRPAKALVCVRDLRDILATLEINWQKIPQFREWFQKHPRAEQMKTLEGRLQVWSSGEEPLGLAFNQIQDAVTRGFRDRLHFVPFEQLTRDPEATMQGIYNFLGEEAFPHDFQNIRQTIWENYVLYNLPERHNIPPRITMIPPLWPKILGPAAAVFEADQRLWTS